MPVCKHCNQKFSNYLKIDGKIKNVSKRKFCIACSPFGYHNTSAVAPVINMVVSGKRKCIECNIIKPLSEFYSGGRRKRCRKCMSVSSKNRVRKNKILAVDYLGGKCIKCGYNSCMDAMEFHHKDPEEKEDGINHMLKGLFENMKRELDKCDLLCVRCHRELHAEDNTINNVHNPITNPPNISEFSASIV
jgi:hypothetical protein